MEFELSDRQWRLARKWMEENQKSSGAIGGQFSFVFTPTSLGMIVKVKDADSELDLTDYDLW